MGNKLALLTKERIVCAKSQINSYNTATDIGHFEKISLKFTMTVNVLFEMKMFGVLTTIMSDESYTPRLLSQDESLEQKIADRHGV